MSLLQLQVTDGVRISKKYRARRESKILTPIDHFQRPWHMRPRVAYPEICPDIEMTSTDDRPVDYTFEQVRQRVAADPRIYPPRLPDNAPGVPAGNRSAAA
jgi:hypothetical protein